MKLEQLLEEIRQLDAKCRLIVEQELLDMRRAEEWSKGNYYSGKYSRKDVA